MGQTTCFFSSHITLPFKERPFTMPLIDRQTLLFLIIMFVFLSLPNGSDQPHSNKDRETLETFQETLKRNRKQTEHSEYYLGYGNVTGFELSYQDNVNGKNILEWPFHKFSRQTPWQEDEKYSLLPNQLSEEIKGFWGTDPVEPYEDANAYLLNITGKSYGEFDKIKPKSKLKNFNMDLPKYLKDHYDLYTQAQYEQDKEQYERDPENNAPPLPPETFNRDKVGNLTFDSGKISLGLKSFNYNYKDTELSKFVKNLTTDAVDDAVIVKVKINLDDFPEIHDNELDTLGVYFQNTGSLVTITSSAKFLGNYALSHFTMNEKNFNTTRLLVSQLLNLTNVEKDVNMDDLNGSIQRAIGQCEYISYFQLEKTEYLTQQLRNIDEELINPSGMPIPSEIPTIQVKQALMYSPDCGMVLRSKTSKPFEGNKSEVTNSKLKKMLTGLLILSIIQLFLLIKQIKELRTPGQLSSVSSTTVSLIAYQDSLIALSFLLVSNLIEELYLILACVAVIAFLMCGVFELRFLVSILTTQSNERGTTWWEILRGATRRTASNEEGLPLPVTSGAPGNTATPAPVAQPTETVPTLNDEARFSNSIFGTGCAMTIISTFLILNALLWRIKYRRLFEYIGLLLLNSYWLPQFLRNTMKNRRRAFLWEFMLGSSMIRILPVWYLCLNTRNPLRHHYDPVLAGITTGWLVVQLFLLYLQQSKGARFWVKENWLPKEYDYHYVLTIKDLEKGGGFSSDLLAGITTDLNNERPNNDADAIAGNTEDGGVVHCKVDCAICMNEIDLPINTNPDGKAKNQVDKVKSSKYMITPCHHIFHTECLEDWMVYKLQCPVCRTALPPV